MDKSTHMSALTTSTHKSNWRPRLPGLLVHLFAVPVGEIKGPTHFLNLFPYCILSFSLTN